MAIQYANKLTGASDSQKKLISKFELNSRSQRRYRIYK